MKYLNLVTNWWLLTKSVLVLCLIISVNNLSAQCSLACNGTTQVSLNADCEAMITFEMILNDQSSSCPGVTNFVVEVSDQYGLIPTSPMVTGDYTNQTLTASIKDPSSGNSCWGFIDIENKLGPSVDCPTSPVVMDCVDLSVYEGPEFTDNCDSEITPILLSETIETPCLTGTIKVITREYTAVDAEGIPAANTCEVEIRLRRFQWGRLIYPEDRTLADNTYLDCSAECWDTNNNGYPDPEEIGVVKYNVIQNGAISDVVDLYPIPDIYCNTIVTFDDTVLPKIGCTQKIMRRWSVREWHCDGEVVENMTQVIEITDNLAPELKCENSIQVTTNTLTGSTNSHYGSVTCGATVALSLPQATDNCSANLSYDVTYSGGFEKNYTGNSPIVLPMGSSVVEFAVYDDCYNSSTCNVTVEVIDNTPPVAVCDQNTVVSLTTGGQAVVLASSFDDGSYDDCKAHCNLVRRMTPGTCSCKKPEFCDLDYIGTRDGSNYYLSSYNIASSIAKNRAAAYGGSLVIFEDADEEDWLVGEVRKSYQDRFWIGMKRHGAGFLWDNHEPLSYNNWRVGAPTSNSANIDLTQHNTVGNAVLVNDGAVRDNSNDMVSALTIAQGMTNNSLTVSWNWIPRSAGVNTALNGVNMKLLHYSGGCWNTIYTESYTGTSSTNTVGALLNITQTSSFNYTVPSDASCGTNYFRVAIEDNVKVGDVIQGNFGSNHQNSHFDNADVAFELSGPACSPDCVMVTPANEWNDASCAAEWRYVLEIKDECGFSNKANFCCSDVGTDQMVVFRVVDVFGNFNDCMVNVEVQNKVAVSLSCPPNENVNCNIPYDVDNLSLLYGTATMGDACGDIEMIETVLDETNQCNIGEIVRTFTITTNGGQTSSCKQVLTFNNNDPFDGSSIVCPRDTTINGCKIPDDLGPDLMGYPQFINDQCDLVGTDYNDEVFTFNNSNGDACLKILRTWEIVNWCETDPVTGFFPIWRCQQVIKVTNSEKPIITGCEAKQICTYDSDCENGYIDLEVTATDDCTDDANLRWQYEIYAGQLGLGPAAFSDPILEESGDGNIANASGKYPIGSHIIRWTFFDRCGNATTCDQAFTIMNCKAPTAYCINGLAVDLMQDIGMVELWASDFDAGSSHPCGYPVFLSFSADTSDRNITFDCTTRGDQEVDIWVSSPGPEGILIQTFCSTFVNVQDNTGACVGERVVTVGGSVFTENFENVSVVDVDLEGSTLSAATDTNGEYSFPNMPTGGDYTVNPANDKNPLNGVSTLDLIVIQRHILGTELLDSPYKIIAADANRDETVSALDLIELRKLILGVNENFTNNTSWRFVDNGYVFNDPSNPFLSQIAEKYEINNLNSDMDIDFVAVKIGDVDNSANLTDSDVLNSRSESITNLSYDVKNFEKGQLLEIPITINNNELIGFQFKMLFNNNLIDIMAIESDDLNLNAGNYAIGSDAVSLSWNNINANFKNGVSFTIIASAKGNGNLNDIFSISNNDLTAEVYSRNGNVTRPIINMKENVEYTDQLKLYQNTPNPFAVNTSVDFYLGQAGDVNVVVHDVDGRLVYTHEANYTKGNHSIEMNSKELGSAGVFYLTISTNEEFATMKMVVIK